MAASDARWRPIRGRTRIGLFLVGVLTVPTLMTLWGAWISLGDLRRDGGWYNLVMVVAFVVVAPVALLYVAKATVRKARVID